ncbi:hypothetical protein [Calothrix sp. NIES-3974]|uniref:hypothetical protein n=1 Tax=Calothrix sp. NIES-3974 TaxID=2005462 RepID=UPI000BBCEFCB|nr:hypothetical protein [Calothrix sp. NIES-3974]
MIFKSLDYGLRSQLVFSLNIFNAFFTPTYQATIPLVTGEDDYPQAIALSNARKQGEQGQKMYQNFSEMV